jgi:hypothetical protein
VPRAWLESSEAASAIARQGHAPCKTRSLGDMVKAWDKIAAVLAGCLGFWGDNDVNEEVR